MFADFRYAFRSLRRWPLGTAMAIVTLTVAIGSATSLYSFLDAVLSIQAPHISDLERIARVYVVNRAAGVERGPMSMADFSRVASASSFEVIAAYQSSERQIVVGNARRTISVGIVSESFFDVLRTPVSGRLIGAADAGRGVMVVSNALWRELFADRTPGNATLSMNGTSWTITGVLPPAFGSALLGIDEDAYVLMNPSEGMPHRTISVIGRLRADRSWSAARAELDASASSQFPNRQWTWRIIPVTDDLRARVANASAFVIGPAVIVLLIGCINVSCMLLARGIERRHELAVRSALGASRTRIIRQLLSEQLLLAVIAGVLGCGLSIAILRFLSSQMAVFPGAPPLAPDASIVAVALAITLIAAALVGMWPALRDSRQHARVTAHGAAAAPSRIAGYHARDLVVFTELALAVVLIIVAGMWLTLFGELQRITPSFAGDRVMLARSDRADVASAVTSIGSLPGISGVALSSHVPGGRAPAVMLRAANGRIARGSAMSVQPSFFSTLDLRLHRGRGFDAKEDTSASNVVVISESLARALFPNDDAIGATVKIGQRSGDKTAIVIGICVDALRLGTVGRIGVIPPDFYLPLDLATVQDPVILARTASDAHSMLKPVEQILGSSESSRGRPVVFADAQHFVPDQSVFLIRMIGAFGIVALLLAASGVFGVVSQSVSQRTGEFGVRMAVGATPAAVLRMVIAREGKLIAVALVSGAALTVGVTRVVFADLIVVAGVDPWLWLGVAALCGGAAATAVTLATRRIVRLDPVSVLRQA